MSGRLRQLLRDPAQLGRWLTRRGGPGHDARARGFVHTKSVRGGKTKEAALRSLGREIGSLWLGLPDLKTHLRSNDLGSGQRYLSLWTEQWLPLREGLAERGIPFQEVGGRTRIYLTDRHQFPLRHLPAERAHLALYLPSQRNEPPEVREVRRVLADTVRLVTEKLPHGHPEDIPFDFAAIQTEAEIHFRRGEVRLTFAPEDVQVARERLTAEEGRWRHTEHTLIPLVRRWDGDTFVIEGARESYTRALHDRYSGGSPPRS